MEPKNFLFVSIDGLIGDTAWDIVKEGHNVKYHIHCPEEKEVADGFVPKVESWKEHVDWADVIVFDDVLGQGTKAKKLRDSGKFVIGGTPYTDKLEDDRTFGQEELSRRTGMSLPLISYHINGTRKADGLKELGLVDTEENKGRVRMTLTTLGRLLIKGYIS